MKELLFECREGANQTAEIVDILAKNKKNTRLIFEPREYHFYREGCFEGTFYPSNNKWGHKHVIFYISECENLVIDGNGATLIFHDRVFPFIVKNCRNVTLKNFTVDFAFPRNYCAVVEESNDDYFEFFIDKKLYPYTIKNGNMICHTESEDISSHDVKFFLSDYDKRGDVGTTINSLMVGECSVKSEDFPTSGLRTYASQPRENSVRFTYVKDSGKMKYFKGHNIVFHFDEDRQYDTFFADECRQITFEGIEILRGAGMGVIAQFSDDVTIDAMKIRRKDGRGDLITTTADALMFVNCGGKFTLKNSYIANSLDDGFNLHGTYTHIESVLTGGLYVRLGHREQVGINPYRIGDKIQVIDGKSLQIKQVLTVVDAKIEGDLKHITVKTKETPTQAEADDFLENHDRMPEVEFVDNVFEMCPSIMIGTPKRVHFARNRIHNRCAGLRIIDSPKLWYESGRARDVLIENNEFIDCGEGYEEYILCVNVNAEFESQENRYIHENIEIRNNKILSKNAKILNISHADGVSVHDNAFKRRDGADSIETCPYHILHCGNVIFKNNIVEM